MAKTTDTDSKRQPGPMSADTRPDDYDERVLRLALLAKHVAFAGGPSTLPPDHYFIRAAMALLLQQHRREQANKHGYPPMPDLDACLLAVQFFDDGTDSDERRALLGTVLPDPADVMRDAVAGNRRLLGLSANEPPKAVEP
jgi:hypothetical protein